MSIYDDPAWQEDARRFCAKLDKITRDTMKPLGPAGWRARRVFRLIEATRAEWLIDARKKDHLPPAL
jgi:hypothetical protein